MVGDPKDCFTFECQPVAMHFRFYDTGYHSDNYRAQFFAFAVGEGVMAVRGLMDKSNGFYRNFAHLLPDVMAAFGAHTMLCEALLPHAKLMQRFLREVADVSVQQPTAQGRELAMVTITLKEKTEDEPEQRYRTVPGPTRGLPLFGELRVGDAGLPRLRTECRAY